MIGMIMPIHVECKKVIFEENLVAKIKLIGKNIERDLRKNLRARKRLVHTGFHLLEEFS